MIFIINPEGIIENIKFIRSPNFSERPANVSIDLLILHNISLPPGHFGNDEVEALFCNRLDFSAHPYYATIAHREVSCHVFIRRTGELVQYVPLTKRAWHAGLSSFQGRNSCNDFSIGIELEGEDEIPYEQAQYHQLAELSRALMEKYPAITLDRIVGHSDVAPGRKTDPGPSFDWDYFHRML